MPGACPTSEQLLAFHLGTLPDEDVEAVAAHLETCPRCETVMQAHEVSVDPILSALRRPADHPPQWAEKSEYEVFKVSRRRSDRGPDPAQPENWPDVPGYEVLAYLGQGGMGTVYKARNLRLGRLVALKRLRSDDDRIIRRSHTEAETLARLQHPNIVQLYEMPEHEGRLYLALELVAGEPLAARLQARPHPPRSTAALLETLARAVHYAHEQGIVHRDLEPANILLSKIQSSRSKVQSPDVGPWTSDLGLWTAKITDFGIAKRLATPSGDTQTGDVIGTPSYMAPEQAAGRVEAIGPATDVYSLGVILYEMLTGRVPLLGPTTLDTLLLIRTEEPVPPRRFQPHVPRDLETICLKCLQKNPAERYPTAAALADDLRRFQKGEPIEARPTPRWERVWKWARRRPAVAGLSAAVVLVAAIGFVLVAWQWQRAASKAVVATLAQRAAEQKTRQAEQLLARTGLTQGRALCEAGNIRRGLLWMVRSIELARRSDDHDLEQAARANLSAWQPYLIRQAASMRHHGWEWAIALSPDGRTAATGGSDCFARLWDVATGKPLGKPMPHTHIIWSVAFSPDGKMLLTGSGALGGRPGEARLWDAATGAPLGPPLQQPMRVTQVSFRPDGHAFLTVCDDGAQLWDSVTRQPIGAAMRHGHLEPDHHTLEKLVALFSPDGRHLATGGDDGTVRFWDAMTAKPVGKRLHATGPVRALAFSPDKPLLAAGCANGDVELWDAATGLRRGPVFRHRGRIRALAFSPDSQVLAAGGIVDQVDPQTGKPRPLAGEVRLWRMGRDWAAGPVLWHPFPVWSVAFSPDGRVLMTGCEDSAVRFFLPMSGQPIGRELGGDGTVASVLWAPTSTLALSSSAGGNPSSGHLWTLPREKELPLPLWQHEGVLSLAFSPDQRELLTGSRDGSARLWDLATGRPLGRIRADGQPVTAVAFSPDGRLILTASADGSLRLWDRQTLHLRLGNMRFHKPTTVAFDPDGRRFVVGGDNPSVEWRDVATGKVLGTASTDIGSVRRLSFRDQGRVLVALGDVGVYRWDSASRRCLGQSHVSGRSRVKSLMPDGRFALLREDGFAEARKFTESEKPGRYLADAAGTIVNFAVSPDGRCAVVTGHDNITRLWDLATDQPIGPVLARDQAAAAIVFSASGRKLATSTLDGRVCVWHVPAPASQPVEVLRARIELLTSMRLDEQGTAHKLSPDETRQRQRCLEPPSP